MPNATAKLSITRTDFIDTKFYWKLSSTATTYYVGEAMGMNAAGYAVKFDDTASLRFIGVCAESADVVVETGGADGDREILVDQPNHFSFKIASVAFTDHGRKVYAVDSQFCGYAGPVFGNYMGSVIRRVATGYVEIRPHYLHETYPRGVTRTMAATGAQSVTKFDLNKTILIPNSAALTLTLPAVADTSPGDRLEFIKTTAAIFAATLDGAGAELIDGAATLATLDGAYDCVTIVSTGTEWIVVNRDLT